MDKKQYFFFLNKSQCTILTTYKCYCYGIIDLQI